MLVPMLLRDPQAEPYGGYCFSCATAVGGDLMDHFAEHHQRVATKPQGRIKSWEHRLDDVQRAITEIREESDRAVQIQRLDAEVIQELYLVRASLTQSKRRAAQVKKG